MLSGACAWSRLCAGSCGADGESKVIQYCTSLLLLYSSSSCQGPVPSTGGAPAAVGAMESKVAKLMELGFSRERVQEALMLTNGNEEQAAGLLFGGL